MPTERSPLVGEVVPTFADKGCHVVNVTEPYGRIFGFLDRSHYFSFQVAPRPQRRSQLNEMYIEMAMF
jgi:hypothetical protein